MRRLKGQRTDFYLLIIKSFFPVWPAVGYVLDTPRLEDLFSAVVSVDFTVRITTRSIKFRASPCYVRCCQATQKDFVDYEVTRCAQVTAD